MRDPPFRLIAAIALLVVGLVLAGLSVAWDRQSGVVDIPANRRAASLELSLSAGQRLTGEFRVINGTEVNFLIMNRSGFVHYGASGAAAGLLYRSYGTLAERFSVMIPESGAYYVVFEHWPGRGSKQVLLTYRYTDTYLLCLGGGIGLAVVGTLLLVTEFWTRAREDRLREEAEGRLGPAARRPPAP